MGLLLPAIPAGRLGLEELVDETVDLGERRGTAGPEGADVALLGLSGGQLKDGNVLLKLSKSRTQRDSNLANPAPATRGSYVPA